MVDDIPATREIPALRKAGVPEAILAAPTLLYQRGTGKLHVDEGCSPGPGQPDQVRINPLALSEARLCKKCAGGALHLRCDLGIRLGACRDLAAAYLLLQQCQRPDAAAHAATLAAECEDAARNLARDEPQVGLTAFTAEARRVRDALHAAAAGLRAGTSVDPVLWGRAAQLLTTVARETVLPEIVNAVAELDEHASGYTNVAGTWFTVPVIKALAEVLLNGCGEESALREAARRSVAALFASAPDPDRLEALVVAYVSHALERAEVARREHDGPAAWAFGKFWAGNVDTRVVPTLYARLLCPGGLVLDELEMESRYHWLAALVPAPVAAAWDTGLGHWFIIAPQARFTAPAEGVDDADVVGTAIRLARSFEGSVPAALEAARGIHHDPAA